MEKVGKVKTVYHFVNDEIRTREPFNLKELEESGVFFVPGNDAGDWSVKVYFPKKWEVGSKVYIYATWSAVEGYSWEEVKVIEIDLKKLLNP